MKLNLINVNWKIFFRIVILSILIFLFYSCASTTPTQTITTYENAKDNLEEGIKQNRLGNYEEALFYINKAIEADSKNQSVYLWLGLTYAYMGRKDEALQMFSNAIRLNPDTKNADEAREWIDSLKKVKVVAIPLFKMPGSYTGYQEILSKNLNKIISKIGFYKAIEDKGLNDWPQQDVEKVCINAEEEDIDIIMLGEVGELATSVKSSYNPFNLVNKLVGIGTLGIIKNTTSIATLGVYKPTSKKGDIDIKVTIQIYSTKSCELLGDFVGSDSREISLKGSISDSVVRAKLIRKASNSIFDRFMKEVHRMVL